MMPPSPLILFAVLMIGYPAAQIASILIRRRSRLRFNAATAHMIADPQVRRFQRAHVWQMMAWSRGGMESLKRFARMPGRMLVMGYRETIDPAKAPHVHKAYDPAAPVPERMESLRGTSALLEMATWPLTAAIVVPVSMLTWSIGAVAAKAQGGAGRVLPHLGDIARVSGALHPSFR